jgi:hypothetical protein
MPISPPSNLTYGTVVGKFYVTGLDSADVGREPDFSAAIGTVSFKPDVLSYKNLSVPATFINTTVTAVIDSNGDMRDTQGNLGVYLIATDNDDLQPRDWTYTVTVSVSGVVYTFPLHVLGGETTDLTFASPAVTTPGTVVVVSHEDALVAQAAAAEAVAAAEAIGGNLDEAIAEYFAENPPSVTSVAGKNGVVTLVKADVGLANVDNTSDANKPISTATSAALANKADLVGGLIPNAQLPPLAITTPFVVASQAAMLALNAQIGDFAIRTDVNKAFVLSTNSPAVLADWIEMASSGSVTSVAGKVGVVSLVKADVGLANVDNTSDVNKPVSTATQAELNLKAPLDSPVFTGTVTGIDKASVGLSNVDNTSDSSKPVSTAQQTALDAKLPYIRTRPLIYATAANAWPTRASQIPAGYTGPVDWDHTEYGEVGPGDPLPADIATNDFVTDLAP